MHFPFLPFIKVIYIYRSITVCYDAIIRKKPIAVGVFQRPYPQRGLIPFMCSIIVTQFYRFVKGFELLFLCCPFFWTADSIGKRIYHSDGFAAMVKQPLNLAHISAFLVCIDRITLAVAMRRDTVSAECLCDALNVFIDSLAASVPLVVRPMLEAVYSPCLLQQAALQSRRERYTARFARLFLFVRPTTFADVLGLGSKNVTNPHTVAQRHFNRKAVCGHKRHEYSVHDLI